MKQYFKETEFMMGSKVVYDKVNPTMPIVINTIRHVIGKPLIITSSFRDEEYNEQVGGTPGSLHLTGDALDFGIGHLSGEEIYKIIKICVSMNISFGINWKKGFMHIDCRETPKTFKY